MQHGTSLPNVDALLASTPYRAVQFLGRGGMGSVFVVEHTFLGRRFAFKALDSHLAADADLVERVELEGQTLGRLRHPNVVEVADFWVTSGGFPCLVMELLQGRTLAEELLQRRRLPEPEAIQLTRQLLSGLGAAHALGVVHRDVKPQNLYLHEMRGYGRILKILDFGLARVMPGAPPTAPSAPRVQTETGTLVGSGRYMSPEAENGQRVDHRADLYGVGLVLFEMLVGEGPFDDGALVPRPPSHYIGEQISPELDAVVLRSIQAHPDARYQTAAQFLAALPSLASTSPRRASP